ncbi:MAG: NAD(P)-dependent oxidoreductase [Humidesulfovibrio sp.]|uniref:NAD-dependent epimerase/dehydratase family protein n=1 Tax=Humidesulfovibrio sp. TaxID=2910988 RepID=UPI0027F6DD8C|nr:NAD(P)-dependent oxidoreductase [Humidesulfovibrio sp.]MDQ7834340.1 NAD(P)-dependent oxidoreductase [Humidesulfovibrio sp.]
MQRLASALSGARILVTGADGFVGANLIKALLDGGVGVDALVSGGGPLKRLGSFMGRPGLNIVTWDLMQNPMSLVEDKGYDLVFHLAAVMPGRPEANDPRAITAVNVTATLELAQALSRRGGLMVFASSFSEYSSKPDPISEETLPLPTNLYGWTKAAAVLGLRSMNIPNAWTVARLFGIFGPFEAPQRLLPYVYGQLTQGREARLTSGEQVRDFLFVEDAVEAVLATALRAQARGRDFNIGTGIGLRVRDVVTMAGEQLGRPELLRFGAVGSISAAPDYAVADNRRVTSELDWHPRVDAREGVERTLAWLAGANVRT